MIDNIEGLRVTINPSLSDRLYTLSVEYSTSVDTLANLAVKRLIEDIDFHRKLRSSITNPE